MTASKQILPALILLFLSTGYITAQFCNPLYVVNHDSITFEGASPYITMDTGSSNIWQMGTPQKLFFNSGYNSSSAVMTDTVNNYPAGASSSFTVTVPWNYIQWDTRTTLSFWHKYDTDTLTDYGTVEASYDGGLSWLLVQDTPLVCMGWGFYWCYDYHASTGSSAVHNPVVSGRSDGWIHSVFEWTWYLPVKTMDTVICQPDSLLIRFKFTSDSIGSGKEGWMIDNIVFSGHSDPGSVRENRNYNAIRLFPNPAQDRIFISNENGTIIPNSIVIYDVLGREQIGLHNTERLQSVNIEALRPGLYYMKFLDRNGSVAVRKFQKVE